MFTEPWYIVFFDIYVKYKRNWINWQLKERTVYTAGVNGLSFLPKKHPNALHNSKITQKCFKRIVKVVQCGFYFLYIKFYLFHSLTHTILLRSVSKMNWFYVFLFGAQMKLKSTNFAINAKSGRLTITWYKAYAFFLYHWFISTYWVLIYIAVKNFHDGILATCRISTAII